MPIIYHTGETSHPNMVVNADKSLTIDNRSDAEKIQANNKFNVDNAAARVRYLMRVNAVKAERTIAKLRKKSKK